MVVRRGSSLLGKPSGVAFMAIVEAITIKATLLLILIGHVHGDNMSDRISFDSAEDYSAIPEWVTQRNNSTMFWQEYMRNIRAVQEIDQSGKRADVLLIGDSITAWNKPMDLSKLKGSRKVWQKNFGDLIAEPLGIPGDRIDDVLWRLAVGGEKTVLDPKVIIVFVGINDIVHKTPNIAERMDYLLGWLRKHSPESRLVVQLLLPSLSPAVDVNLDYTLLAIKHNATASFCMLDMKKNDRNFMVDTLHPNERGQDRLQKCLRRRHVNKYI